VGACTEVCSVCMSLSEHRLERIKSCGSDMSSTSVTMEVTSPHICNEVGKWGGTNREKVHRLLASRFASLTCISPGRATEPFRKGEPDKGFSGKSCPIISAG
jgi:hypothetical protein